MATTGLRNSSLDLIVSIRCWYSYRRFTHTILHNLVRAGVTDVDFSRYPGKELQLDWLSVYLLEYLDRQPTELELRTLYVQVNKFALAAHFLWAVWALVQAEHSTIDFDFLR